MRSLRACALVILILAATGAAATDAIARTRPKKLPIITQFDRVYDALASVQDFDAVTIAPDGRTIAWVEAREKPGAAPADDSAIFVQSLAPGAPPRRISARRDALDHRERAPAFSPDARSLAFISNAGARKQMTLYVAPVAGGKPRQLTHLDAAFDSPAWSPDGQWIACLCIENPSREAGPLAASKIDAGVVEEKIEEQRLALVRVSTGETRLASPADLYLYEFAWSPDGASVVASGAHGSGDDNWWDAELYAIEIATGQAKSILKPPLQMAQPSFSPDGQSIAYIGGLMSDAGVTGGDVFVIPSHGGEPRNLTPGRKTSAAAISWLASGKILVTENATGSAQVIRIDPVNAAADVVWNGPEEISSTHGLGLAATPDGASTAVIRQSTSTPPEIWAGPIGEWKQVTARNAKSRPAWGKVEKVEWTSDDRSVQGWLLAPSGASESGSTAVRKGPMAVIVHGGPSSAHLAGWPNPVAGTLAGVGYWVFLPNPRGSYGQGEAFTRGNVKDFGHGDLQDILSGVDAVVRKYPVDESRLGLFGWSYGGYMAMWTVTQTQRFRAVVAGAGIVNWQSYYGQNRIDRWMIPFFGASVYDDPAVYAKSSPITYIQNVKTPTLVLQGDRDAEVPAPQAYEFWHALKTLGVPTQLVIYPNEGHQFRGTQHRKDRVQRIVDWFDSRLTAAP